MPVEYKIEHARASPLEFSKYGRVILNHHVGILTDATYPKGFGLYLAQVNFSIHRLAL